jgi:hypothetical protein
MLVWPASAAITRDGNRSPTYVALAVSGLPDRDRELDLRAVAETAALAEGESQKAGPAIGELAMNQPKTRKAYKRSITINPPVPRNIGIPERSWWLDESSREAFAAAVERETPRMRQSKYGGQTPSIVPGGLVQR